MKTSIVSKETLEKKVQQALEIISVGTIFISGIQKIKVGEVTHQMIVEILQLKDLDVARDSSLSEYERCVRVSLRMTKEGYEITFPQVVNHISGEELYKRVGQLQDEMVLSIFTAFNEIRLKNETLSLVKPTIAVRQYSDRRDSNFPPRIAAILDINEVDRTEKQCEELKATLMKSKDGERLVDVFGRQVYEITKFTYEEDDIIISKMPLSQHSTYIFNMKSSLPNSDQLAICKYLSNSEDFLWSSEIIEKYSDKWDWGALSANISIPWTLQLINKYADKLSCSETIWKTLKPYLDDEFLEEVFMEISNT